jgi:nucleoid DNA-binding protein
MTSTTAGMDEIVEQIIDRGKIKGATKILIRAIATEVFESVVDLIIDYDGIKIGRVGKLKIHARKARKARNPKTGEPISVPAREVLKISPSLAVKQILLGEKSQS